MYVKTYKYQRHSQAQFESILSAAETLFIQKGQVVGITDIAKACSITRATIYQYFSNRDEILWTVVRKYTDSFSEILSQKLQGKHFTTYEKCTLFLDLFYERFVEAPEFFIFFNSISDLYQKTTSGSPNDLYEKIYGSRKFRSGSSVQILMTDFHDGSVKASLDPKETAVSILYGASCLASSLAHMTETLPAKYGISTSRVFRNALDSLLLGIKP